MGDTCERNMRCWGIEAPRAAAQTWPQLPVSVNLACLIEESMKQAAEELCEPRPVSSGLVPMEFFRSRKRHVAQQQASSLYRGATKGDVYLCKARPKAYTCHSHACSYVATEKLINNIASNISKLSYKPIANTIIIFFFLPSNIFYLIS